MIWQALAGVVGAMLGSTTGQIAKSEPVRALLQVMANNWAANENRPLSVDSVAARLGLNPRILDYRYRPDRAISSRSQDIVVAYMNRYLRNGMARGVEEIYLKYVGLDERAIQRLPRFWNAQSLTLTGTGIAINDDDINQFVFGIKGITKFEWGGRLRDFNDLKLTESTLKKLTDSWPNLKTFRFMIWEQRLRTDTDELFRYCEEIEKYFASKVPQCKVEFLFEEYNPMTDQFYDLI